MSTTQYVPNLSVGAITVNSVSESTDLVAQGGSLAPSTSNAAIIKHWIQKIVNTLTYPSFQAQLTPPPIYSNLSTAAINSAVAIYSMALVRPAYSGQVADVRRSSDNAVGNVYADIYGNLTVSGSSYASWVGAGTGYIVNWYDQSGAGLTLNQPTPANQPTLNTATTPASITFSAASSTFLVNSSFTFNFGAGSFTMSTIISNNTGGCLFYKGPSGYPWSATHQKKWWMGNSTNTETSTGNFPTFVGYGENYVYPGGSIPAAGNAAVTFIATSTTNMNVYVNGQQIVTGQGISMGTDPANYLYVGIGGNATAYTGNMYQLMVFSSQLGTNDRRIVEGAPNIPINATQPYWSNTVTWSSISIGSGSASGSYSGSVLLPDGRVIFVPYFVANIGVFNPATNQFSTVTSSSLATGTYFSGGVLLPDGRVFFTPYFTATAGLFNPVTNTYSSITAGVTANIYYGGCLGADGNVYTAGSSTIGIFNPNTNTFSSITPGGGFTGGYSGALSLFDGRIVFAPYSSTNVGVFNPVGQTFTSYPATTGSSSAYQNGVVLPNGNACFIPVNATNIGIFNSSTNTFSSINSTGVGSSNYYRGTLLPNGNVIFSPYAATNVGIYNYINNTFSTVASGGPPGGNAYQGCSLLPDGRVVFPPSFTTANLGILSGGILVPADLCLHPIFNKF